MIRRWSYINTLNNLPSLDIKKIRISSSDAIVNSLMYLRREFPIQTRARRKSWARRIHTNDLLTLSNVMIIWAKEYRFFRNYNRSVTYQFFSKNTYLSFNLTFSKPLLARYSKSNVSSLGSSIPKNLIHYFRRSFVRSRLEYLLVYRNHSWSLASFPSSISSEKEPQLSTHHPFAVTDTHSLIPVNTIKSDSGLIAATLALTARVFTAWVIALYGVLVKLFLFRLVL